MQKLTKKLSLGTCFGLVFVFSFAFAIFSTGSASALSCSSNSSTQSACDDYEYDHVAHGTAWLTTDTTNKSNAVIYYKGDLAGQLKVHIYGAVYKGTGGTAKHVRILTSAVSHATGMTPTDVATQRTVHGAFTDFTESSFERGSGSSDNGFSVGWESGGAEHNVNLDYIKSNMSPNCGDGCYTFTVHVYRCFGDYTHATACYSDPVVIRIEPDPSEPTPETANYNFASKSGVGYNSRTQTFSALNGTTNQAVTLSYNTTKATVNFTQRIYLKLDGRAPNSFNPIVNTTHSITSSTTPQAATQGNTKLTSQAAGWKIASESGYYYQDVKTSDLEVTVPETGSVKVCQKISYNHQNITITTTGGSSTASYSGNGSSEACITFTRGAKPPDPPENYCEGKNIYSINRGDTYGWSQVTNLNSDKTKNTMDENTNTVTVYARPGDTVTYAHAFCYGAQAVRSTNGVYTTDYTDSARTSFVNLYENTFSIYGTTRVGSKGASGYSASYSTSGTADYAFGIKRGPFREYMSVPIQQLAEVMYLDENGTGRVELTEEERTALKKLLPDEETLLYGFNQSNADSPKAIFDETLLKSDLLGYLKIYLSVGSKNRAVYRDAWIYLVHPYFLMNDNEDRALMLYDFLSLYFEEDELDISATPQYLLFYRQYLDNAVRDDVRWYHEPIIAFLLLGLLMGRIIAEKNNKLFAGSLLAVIYFAGIMMAPVALMRYTYPLMLSMPLFLGMA